jgi:hypothetical protein
MNALVHAHSGLRYVVLALLLAAIYTAFSNKNNANAPYSKIYLWAMIATHTQILIGLILYFMSPKVNFSMMSEPFYRFYNVEHITGMLIAAVLITIGHRQAKNLNHGKTLAYYGIGLLVILASIPWPFRAALGGSWF